MIFVENYPSSKIKVGENFMKKRLLSTLLLLTMLVTAVPFAAVETMAAEAPTAEGSLVEENADFDELYVEDAKSIYTAFVGDKDALAPSGSHILWINRVSGAKSATFENTGWSYNEKQGGIGYDLIYGQIDASGAFSATYSGDKGKRMMVQNLAKWKKTY